MAMISTGVGQCTYNGVTLPASPDSYVRAQPVYDDANRTVVYTVYKLHFAFIVQAIDGTIDATMLAYRRALEKAGQSLQYESNGLGGMTINVGAQKDVVWGPKPRMLEFRPLGGGYAWQVRWEVEVAIPECSNAIYTKGLLAFNYEYAVSIDADGYSTRAYSGYIEIPMTRVGGARVVPDTADAYWEKIVPEIPNGFRRVTRDRKLSLDKRRLDFVIADEQIPGGAYPPGVTFATGTHNTRSEPNNMVRFVSTLTANYHIGAGGKRGDALDAFYALMRDRMKAARNIGAATLLISFSADEGLYHDSRKLSFSVQWSYLSNIADCIKESGQWRPVPGMTWAQWLASANVALNMGPRGSAGLMHLAGDDTIIDLCGPANPKGAIGALRGIGNPRLNELRANGQTSVDPEKSWLSYACRLEVVNKANTVRLKTLPETQLPSLTSGRAAGEMGEVPLPSGASTAGQQAIRQLQNIQQQLSAAQAGRLRSSANIPKDPVQQRASPSYRAYLIGHGIRAGNPVPIPRLKSVGGVIPIPKEGMISKNRIVANFEGVPIVRSDWILEYLVPEEPDRNSLVIPPNPALGFGQ